jgi:hypothetical protein
MTQPPRASFFYGLVAGMALALMPWPGGFHDAVTMIVDIVLIGIMVIAALDSAPAGQLEQNGRWDHTDEAGDFHPAHQAGRRE